MAIKSSEKGDKKEVKEAKNSTESVIETPITVDELDKKDLMQMMSELQAQFDDLKKTKKFEEQEEYDILDDYLETPAIFFCFSQQLNIHADMRMGRESLPPLDFVKFKPLYRYYRKNTKGVDVISVSQCLIRSGEQAKWLREHTQFGIKFFENINDAQSVDTTLAEKMAEQSGRVGRMSDLAVIEKCNFAEIPVHTDLSKLRKELIQKLAQDDINKSSQRKSEFFTASRDENGRIETASIINKSEGDQIDSEVY